MELVVQTQWLPDGTFASTCGGERVTPERPLIMTGGAATALKLNLSRSDGTALTAGCFTKAYLAIVSEGEVLAAVETGHSVTAKADGSLEICWSKLPVSGSALLAKTFDRRSDEVSAPAPLRRDYEGLFTCCRCALEIAGYAAAGDEEPQLRLLIPAAVFPRLHRSTLPEESRQSYFYTKVEADALLAAKQAAITGGTQGQVVGFDSEGECVPQDPSGGNAAEWEVSTVTAAGGTVTIPADGGHVYLYTAVAGDVFVFTTPASGISAEFEIDLRQPDGDAVSFTLPEGVVWRFGSPDLSTAGKLYQLKFRYLDGTWEGWSVPEMSEYAKLSGGTFTGAVRITTVTGDRAILTVRDKDGYGKVDSSSWGYASKYLGFNFAQGSNTYASQNAAAFGLETHAEPHQVAFGKYNVWNTDHSKAQAVIIGGGTSEAARKNVAEFDFEGNLALAGDLSVTLNGSTVTVASLVARIEALEQA